MKTHYSILNEIFGLGLAAKEKSYDPSIIAQRGTQGLRGFAYGILMRKADANGMPTGAPAEVKRGRVMRHLGENDEAFHNRLHLHFQKPMEHSDAFTYTPHVDNLHEYLQLRTGRPFAHSTHIDPDTKETTFFSHHLYPIYKD